MLEILPIMLALRMVISYLLCPKLCWHKPNRYLLLNTLNSYVHSDICINSIGCIMGTTVSESCVQRKLMLGGKNDA